ncbi:unnamed protein product [Cladocopium goreaui]|uniref:Chaperone protein DnaJ n=1 Tax=Cladocopium goreaui TaxID=2562237 RepID=A0A9P1CUJ8_9DINO|nr:unnamed protein product [Cladocopium goreaui]
MPIQRDYYEVLGVARDADGDTIATSYRKLAIKYHPDKNPGDDEAVARFKECAEAFEVLGDQEKRSRYDRFGHAGVNGQGHAGSGFGDVEDIFSAFGDVFGDLFGGGRGRGRARAGRDVRCDVTLTLHEAAEGVTKTVEFQRHEECEECDGSGATPGSQRETCGYCGGRGQVVQAAGIIRMQTTCPACHGAGATISNPCRPCRGSGRRLRTVSTEVRIPAGVDEGTRVRITGQGEPSPDGGVAGDCYCFISVKEHPLFEREGQHLVCRVPITYTQAALGCDLEVPTLDGRDSVTLPPGTQSGDVFRLSGRGMPDPRRHGLGDLLVQVTIEVPKKLSADEERVLRELAELEHTNVAPQRKSFFGQLKDYFVGEEDASTADASQQAQDAPVDPAETIDFEAADGAPSAEDQLAAAEDRALRLQAELQNVLNRTRREVAEERKYGPLGVARDLLPAIDNIDRALEAAEKASGDGDGDLLTGFRMVREQLIGVLGQHGCEAIATEGGVEFDPAFHEAILQQPSEDAPAGMILMATQTGYKLHDRVVRPAQCDACGHEFELFQQISEPVKRKCPECGKLKLRRLFGTGAAVVFKGSGFYETDYRSDSYKKGAEKDKKSSEKKSEKKGDSKSETKSESTKKSDSANGLQPIAYSHRPMLCPTCDQEFDPAETPAMPFCSERCRTRDLGRWLDEEYSLPHVPDPDSDEAGEL